MAEVIIRISRTRKDGIGLVKAILEGKMDNEMSYDEKSALHFVTGWNRKLSEYRLFKSQRTYRANKRGSTMDIQAIK